ncbi:MAG: hypothetical protein JSV38_11735 [Desulfobacterales bacterium]|nr:MAG: hypothetical protein JSV38_11735 [Desulfobacterales bacterium]
MEISGNNVNAQVISGLHNQEKHPLKGPSHKQSVENENPQTQSTPPPPESHDISKDEKVKGVIRNLQEGHFKGVADVRLRINFFEELSTMAQQETQKVVGENVPGVIESVNANVENLISSGELSEEQTTAVAEHMAALTVSVELIKQDFFNSEQPAIDDLISGLNADFEKFITSVSLALFPIEPESPEAVSTQGDEGIGEAMDDISFRGISIEESIEVVATPGEVSVEESPDVVFTPGEVGIEESLGVTPVDGGKDENIEVDQVVAPVTIFQDVIANLRAAFAESINDLTNALNDSKILPDLSEPNGNGKAFDKFLAIYNSLHGVDEDDYISQTV